VCGDFKAPPEKPRGVILEDTDTEQTVATMVDWLDERKLI